LADIPGAGCVNHVWITADTENTDGEPNFLRKLLLKMYWDGEEEPSVLVPLGDFFGTGHARTVDFASAPLQMSPGDGKSFNCFFHMPFACGARVEVTSELERERVLFYYYVDYEEFDELEGGLGRFHAQWRRENTTDGVEQGEETNLEFQIEGENLSGEGNYVLLEAEGKGHYVGCVLNVHNLRETDRWNWYGEGGRHDLYRRGGVAALPPRYRHRRLLRHRLVPPTAVLRALSWDHVRRRRELERAGKLLPVPRRRPGDLREIHTGHRRARPRQQAQRRLLLGRLLVPDRAAQTVHYPTG
jgi:hypothetical protein